MPDWLKILVLATPPATLAIATIWLATAWLSCYAQRELEAAQLDVVSSLQHAHLKAATREAGKELFFSQIIQPKNSLARCNQAAIEYQLAGLEFEQGNFESARQHATESIAEISGSSDAELLAEQMVWSLCLLGSIEKDMMLFEPATEHLMKAREIFAKLSTSKTNQVTLIDRRMIQALEDCANCQSNLGNGKQAKTMLEEALNLCRKVGSLPATEENLQRALLSSLAITGADKRVVNQQLEWRALLSDAQSRAKSRDFNGAKEILEQALGQLRSSATDESKFQRCLTLVRLALINVELLDYNQAVSRGNEALSLLNSSPEVSGKLSVEEKERLYYAVSISCYKNDAYKDQTPIFEAEWRLRQELEGQQSKRTLFAQARYALCLARNNKIAEAEKTARACLVDLEEQGKQTDRQEGFSYTCLGKALFECKHYAEAAHCFELAHDTVIAKMDESSGFANVTRAQWSCALLLAGDSKKLATLKPINETSFAAWRGKSENEKTTLVRETLYPADITRQQNLPDASQKCLSLVRPYILKVDPAWSG